MKISERNNFEAFFQLAADDVALAISVVMCYTQLSIATHD